MSTAPANDKVTSVIVLKPNSPTTDQLIQVLSANKSVEIIQVETAQEVVQLSAQMQPCIVLTSVIDPKAIVNIMSMLKGIYPLAKKGRIKSLMISAVKNGQIRVAAQKLMVTEFIEEPIPSRTLQFKSNLLVKAIDAIKKRDAELRAQEETISIKQGEQAKAKEAYAPEAKMKGALNNASDAFTFRGSKVKKTDSRTQFNLGGPDPESGEWKEHKNTEEGKTQWRWVPKDPNELEKIGGEKGKDGWLADGEKPEFDHNKKKWQFGGPKPGLSHYKDGRKEATKAEVNANGELEVAEDSAIAEEKVRRSLEAIAKRAETGDKAKKEKSQQDLADRQQQSKDSQEIGKQNAAVRAKEQAEKLAKLKEAGEAVIKEKAATSEKAAKELKARAEKPEIGAANADAEKKEKGAKESAADRLAKLKGEMGEEGDPEAEAPKGLDAANIVPTDKAPSDLNDKTGKDPAAKKAPRDLSKLKAQLLEEGEEAIGESLEKENAPAPEKAQKEIGADIAAAGAKEKPEKEKLSAAERMAAFKNRLGNMEDEGGANHSELDKAQDPNAVNGGKAGILNRRTEKNHEEKERRKRELKKQIQDEVNEPIPEKLDPALREKLEKETGSEKGKIPDKELAKLAKLGRLKNLKKKLNDADLEIEEGSDDGKSKGKFQAHDLTPDSDGRTDSEKNNNFEEERKKWSASDSDQEEKEVEWRGKKSISLKPPKLDSENEDGREVFYLDETELRTKQPAWERSENYYVCIGAENRYRGFKSLGELLPIWSYTGKDKPEFLDKKKQWRFYDVAPVRYDNTENVPKEISDYLLSINQQLDSNKKKKRDPESEALAEADSEKEKKKDEKRAKIAALMSEVEASKTDPEDEQPSFNLQELKRQKQEKIQAELEALQREMAEIEKAEEEKEASRAAAIESMAEETANEANDRDSKKREYREQLNERLNKTVELSANDADESLYEESAPKTQQESKMDELRAKVNEGSAPDSALEQAAPSAVDALDSKVKSGEAQDFLKKRKERLAESLDEAGSKDIGRKHQEVIASQEKAGGATPPMKLGDAIGVSLLISDALFDARDLLAKPAALLKAVGDRFGSCCATILENIDDKSGKVAGCQGDRHQIGETLSASNLGEGDFFDRICVPVLHSKTQKILGFLQIEPMSPRKNFDSSDMRILKVICVVVGEYWTHLHEKKKQGKAA